jgi:hypothetical protein
MEEVARAAEVLARATEVSGGATVAVTALALPPAKPSRKRKRGFSTLR